jgi:hypothetical protein
MAVIQADGGGQKLLLCKQCAVQCSGEADVRRTSMQWHCEGLRVGLAHRGLVEAFRGIRFDSLVGNASNTSSTAVLGR